MKLNLNTMSTAELQGQFKRFGAQAKQLCGVGRDGQPLGARVEKFFEDLLKSTSDPEQIRQRNEFMQRCSEDPVLRRQLAAIRIETLNNYILATVNFMKRFFEVVELKEDERPVIQYTTDQEILISYVGADGGMKSRKVVKDDDEVLIPLRWLTTERLRYRRVDIYRGTIVDAALATLRMSYDLSNQIDNLSYQLLTDATNGAFGQFIYPGSVAGAGQGSGTVPPAHVTDYTYLPNSRIVTANLPKTNDIQLATNTASSSFRYEVLRAIDKYYAQWRGCFPEGDPIPTGQIVIPGADASDIAAEIVPSGNTNNRVADELLERGYSRINYLGRDWELVTDNTIAPGSCYAGCNRKPGRAYFKPKLDREVVKGEDDYQLSQNNEEERWAQKPIGLYITNVTRQFIVRVTYKST